MAIDILITQNKRRPSTYLEQYVLSFDNDGYYWFLYPLFENLFAVTGNLIDLYGDARFESHHFPILRNTLETAREMVEQQPAEWSVYVAYQLKPEAREIYKSVTKNNFELKLDKFEEMIDYAEIHDEDIVCIGD